MIALPDTLCGSQGSRCGIFTNKRRYRYNSPTPKQATRLHPGTGLRLLAPLLLYLYRFVSDLCLFRLGALPRRLLCLGRLARSPLDPRSRRRWRRRRPARLLLENHPTQQLLLQVLLFVLGRGLGGRRGRGCRAAGDGGGGVQGVRADEGGGRGRGGRARGDRPASSARNCKSAAGKQDTVPDAGRTGGHQGRGKARGPVAKRARWSLLTP